MKGFLKTQEKNPDVIEIKDISAEGRARLLDMAYLRLRFGFAMMPIICTIFAWYYHYENHPASDYRVVIWTLLYFVGFCSSLWLNKIYQQDKRRLPAEDMLVKWLPKIHLIAIVHGLAIATLLPLVKDTASIEYKYLYLAVMAAMVSGNASHQSPMLSVFHRFLASSWHVTVVLFPWTVPSHWQLMVPLAIMYSVGMYRYSLTSHYFFVRMVWLEEESKRLADRYKSAKEQVEAALQAKNQFLTTASHDLRQPVHAMGFLIEAIAHRNQDALLVPALKDLKQSVHTVTQMFSSLLDLSKIESGKVKIQISHVYLDSLAKEIAAIFAEEARARGLKLRVWISKKNPITYTDRHLLHQSIMNLMHNALRYTRTGGILLAVRKRDAGWQVEVWDTGIGVALEDQDKIYSPFFRNEHAWRVNSAGHGLGLSVVARCCELMECQYGFTSKLGKGSRFWLRLPQVSDRVDSLHIANENSGDESWGAKTMLTGTCLIVDDDPQVSNAWQQLLSSWGVHAICTESGLQALDLLTTGFKPQAILCDQRLRAGESGVDVLKALLEACPTASGAMVSGEFDSPELKLAENEGYLVLHKPLEPSVLYDVLSRWMRT